MRKKNSTVWRNDGVGSSVCIYISYGSNVICKHADYGQFIPRDEADDVPNAREDESQPCPAEWIQYTRWPHAVGYWPSTICPQTNQFSFSSVSWKIIPPSLPSPNIQTQNYSVILLKKNKIKSTKKQIIIIKKINRPWGEKFLIIILLNLF